MDDCAFNKDCWCSVLKHKKCSGCTFYKTKKQLENEQYCSEIRLKVLGKWDYYKEQYKLVERGSIQMVSFIVGLFVSAAVGVFSMALFFAGRDEEK